MGTPLQKKEEMSDEPDGPSVLNEPESWLTKLSQRGCGQGAIQWEEVEKYVARDMKDAYGCRGFEHHEAFQCFHEVFCEEPCPEVSDEVHAQVPYLRQLLSSCWKTEVPSHPQLCFCKSPRSEVQGGDDGESAL